METEKNINTHFPEVKGLEINYSEQPGLSNGGSPNILIQDEVGIVRQYPKTPTESYKGYIWDGSNLPQKDSGPFEWAIQGSDPAVGGIQTGAEPVITTAGDFYEQLLQQPRVVQAEVLIKKDKIYTIRRVTLGKDPQETYIAGSDLTDFQKEIILDKILGEYRSQGDEVAVAIAKKSEPMFDNSSLMKQMKVAFDKVQIDNYKSYEKELEKNLMFGSGVPAEKLGVDPEKAFGINLHKSYFGDDAKNSDVVTAMAMALMSSGSINIPDPSMKPLIDVPGT